MKYECPVCKADLIHKRIDDGVEIHRINKNGKVKLLDSSSDGCDEVYCSKNTNHEIPEELYEAVLDIV